MFSLPIFRGYNTIHSSCSDSPSVCAHRSDSPSVIYCYLRMFTNNIRAARTDSADRANSSGGCVQMAQTER